MIKRKKIIIGLIVLVAVGVLASLGWAGRQIAEKKSKSDTAKIEKQPSQPETSTTTETEKAPSVKSQEPQLENYVSKEILFIPWGSGEGEIGLKIVEMTEQIDPRPILVRYGATKLEVDENSNLYIWDDVVSMPRIDSPYKRIIKEVKSNKVLKYLKEKKKEEKTGKYTYVESIPLTLERLTINGKAFAINKFKSEYQYEITFDEKKEVRTEIKIKDLSGKPVGEIISTEILMYYSTPLGFDKEGNFYLLIDVTDIGRAFTSDAQILKIYKYSKEGRFLAEINLQIDELEWTDRNYGQKDRIKVDKEGNIYQLLPKEDGVHIYKWEIK